jgi:type III secretion protein Q
VLADGPRAPQRRFRLIIGKGHSMQTDVSYDPSSGNATALDVPTLQPEDDRPDEAAPLPVDQLQVPVAFELDTARISLADLASLGPGYVIELDQPLTSAEVRLVCHGQIVGRGQLVAVGEQLGVRIVAMGTAGHAAGSAR